MGMRLVRPAIERQMEHEAYVEEWETDRMTPSSFHLGGYKSYEAYLTSLHKRERGEGKWLPSTNYMLVDDQDVVVALVDIRHALNRHLLNVGGHIGYSTRPSKRGKGYATIVLAEALKKCKALQIDRVLVTCNLSNTASARVIEKNGGVEAEHYVESDGNVVRRFWIDNGE